MHVGNPFTHERVGIVLGVAPAVVSETRDWSFGLFLAALGATLVVACAVAAAVARARGSSPLGAGASLAGSIAGAAVGSKLAIVVLEAIF
jgi:hypothetical protein